MSCLLFSTAAYSQIDFGVKTGLNLANITNSEAKMKPSVHIGVIAEAGVANFLGIQPELVYSRQGSFAKEDGVKSWLRTNYLNLPVMAKFYINDKLSLDVGPQFGYMMNTKIKGKYEGVTMTINWKDASDYIDVDRNRFDVSLGMGLTYKLPLNLEVYGRYNLGLTNVFDVDDESNKNSVIQLGVGYRF